MTSESENGGDLRWLLSPPAPGETRIHLAVGEGTELTPALREAIERLIDAFNGQDVQGHLLATTCFPKCGDLADCGTFSCKPLHNCGPLSQQPCAAYMDCAIGPAPRLLR
jgi:hypothetical protein